MSKGTKPKPIRVPKKGIVSRPRFLSANSVHFITLKERRDAEEWTDFEGGCGFTDPRWPYQLEEDEEFRNARKKQKEA